MFTFSQMVDDIVSETKRPDLVSDISRYLNQTIRECHFTSDRNAAIFFKDNFKESQITATTANGQQWEVPNLTTFQKIAAVMYPAQASRLGHPIWPVETTPGRHIHELCHYFYQVGSVFIFSGYGGVGDKINLGWYEFPPSLKYFPAANRPASYDEIDGWTYQPTITTDEDKEAARLVTTNWLLMRWNTVIGEGVRAKVYKRIADTERARTSYSLYAQLRQGLFTSEEADMGGPR